MLFSLSHELYRTHCGLGAIRYGLCHLQQTAGTVTGRKQAGHSRRAVSVRLDARAVQLRAGIAKLPHVKSISGIGLMVGIEFYDVTAADVLAACREKGLLVLTAKTRLRLLPPLTLTAHDVDMALEVLAEVLGAMEPTAPKEQA